VLIWQSTFHDHCAAKVTIIVVTYLSYDDCLENKKKDYQIYSVLYCVQQLYSVTCILLWTVLTGELGPVGLEELN